MQDNKITETILMIMVVLWPYSSGGPDAQTKSTQQQEQVKLSPSSIEATAVTDSLKTVYYEKLEARDKNVDKLIEAKKKAEKAVKVEKKRADSLAVQNRKLQAENVILRAPKPIEYELDTVFNINAVPLERLKMPKIKKRRRIFGIF